MDTLKHAMTVLAFAAVVFALIPMGAVVTNMLHQGTRRRLAVHAPAAVAQCVAIAQTATVTLILWATAFAAVAKLVR